ncbi:hypothetical protein DdX_11783 [Ditylenchus destructor]|uniref:Uncharacterized protein n=1 Tax=Ditylenchus destructor TaxID=166010 RepID=A0AAD4R4D3_9BILA|nr:hypothetical protein DdX_11783 [Ditylenchus destructor]
MNSPRNGIEEKESQSIPEPLWRLAGPAWVVLIYVGVKLSDTIFLATANQYAWVNDLCTVVIPTYFLLWASTKMRDMTFSVLNVYKTYKEFKEIWAEIAKIKAALQNSLNHHSASVSASANHS